MHLSEDLFLHGATHMFATANAVAHLYKFRDKGDSLLATVDVVRQHQPKVEHSTSEVRLEL